ncbi:thioesterase family protein [Emcibacter sp. SYSU 3D8]|uniref:acyl-CoA thioesterase n=1 Tax=Emcibacter sp. SYSU 3D8 TaxID=3133969 RepID=UPI0031FF452C
MSNTDWDALARRASYAVFTPILVRIRDLDQQAHVNNSVIAAYLEEGRYRLLNLTIRQQLPADAIGGFVVAEQTIRYLQEIRETGELTVGTRVDRIGNSSFAMGQGIFLGETCMATALLTMVHISRETRKGERLSDAFRTNLETYLTRA